MKTSEISPKPKNPNKDMAENKHHLIFVLVLIIIAVWLLESCLDAYVYFRNTTILQQLINPQSNELWRRFLIILLILAVCLYFRRTLTQLTAINRRLYREIEERLEAEQDYKDLLLQDELILHSAGEGIYGLDVAGEVTFVNPAASTISGYAARELIGQDIHALLHHTRADGTPHPKEACPIYGSLKTGQVHRVDHDLFWSKQGLPFPVEYVSAPILKDGQVAGVVVVFRDITARARAEEELKQERDFISTLLDTVGALVVVLDREGRVVRFNRACEKITGYSFEEVQGKVLWELFIPPEEVEENQSLFRQMVDGCLNGINENHWITRDGRQCLIAWSNTVLREAAGPVTHIIGTGIDVTDHHQADKELKQAKEYLENVLDNSADAIGIVDAHGRIIKWNKASANVFGYSSEELTGKSAFELYADKNALKTMLAQLRRDGTVQRYEIQMNKKNGSVGLFSLSINLLYDQDHRVIGSVCVARDRSEIKQTLSDLANVNAQLHNEIAERKQVEVALQEANQNLKEIIREFEQRNRDITLLNEMGDLLQACLTCAEAYTGIAHFASLLFPDESGALFILNVPKKLMEAVATWGELELNEPVFSPEDCWALRRGEVHAVSSQQPGLICPHLAEAPPGDHVCIPLVAQGEIMGLILLQGRACRVDSPESLRQQLTESKQRLALTLARQISLALANLKLRDSLRIQAIRDPLTGLFNRRYMEETLDRELLRVKRRHKPLGVIMVDLDFLKPINDSLGHEAGDKLIGAMGQFLKAHIRREDVACRYGGDEFTLILPEASVEIARQRAEELRQGINRLQVVYAGQPLGPISASFGLATFPDHGATGEELVRAADAALYHAKQRGRNQLGIALLPENPESPAEFEPLGETKH
jgi:diguanylate cyclase (GGDEF)-like protein/PAS domain S-box-containing protein